MSSRIGGLLFGAGWLVIAVAAILFFVIGTNFYLVPPENAFVDGALHPQRWWIAGGTFFSMAVSGLILLGISGIIQAIEVGKIEVSEKADPQQGFDSRDYNAALDR